MEYWHSLPYSIYCLVMARYCPLPGQLCAIARHKTIRREIKFSWTICKKDYSRFYSSLFTKSAETPINTGGVGGEEWWFTLHHSSLIARFSYHLFQDLVFIDDRAWSSLMTKPSLHWWRNHCLADILSSKIIWVKSGEEWWRVSSTLHPPNHLIYNILYHPGEGWRVN